MLEFFKVIYLKVIVNFKTEIIYSPKILQICHFYRSIRKTMPNSNLVYCLLCSTLELNLKIVTLL